MKSGLARGPLLLLVLVLLAGAAAGGDGGEPAEDPSPAAAALEVFASKCAECHGPSIRKPKGGFGYVTDLDRLSSDPVLVVPGAPEKSEVYLRLIAEDPKERMPPPKAKGGGLTPEQVARVRRWIEVGAPPLASGPSDHHSGDAPAGVHRLLRWLGRFHPVVVHFPIALLLCAVLAEFLGAATNPSRFAPVVTFLVVAGAAGAVVAAVLGWLAAAGEPSSGGTLLVHRWLGVAAATAACAAAAWRWALVRRSRTAGLGFRLLLAATGLLVGVAGHFGALLVHGRDHFAW